MFTHDDAICILVGRDHLGLKGGKCSCNMAGLQQKKHLQSVVCRGCAPQSTDQRWLGRDSNVTVQASVWGVQTSPSKAGVAADVAYGRQSMVSLTTRGSPHSGRMLCPAAAFASMAAASCSTCTAQKGCILSENMTMTVQLRRQLLMGAPCMAKGPSGCHVNRHMKMKRLVLL